MRLISVFIRRRIWIFTHHWLSELSLSLLLPVAIYLSVSLGLAGVIKPPMGGVSFQAWIQPGLIFLVALIASYLPVFADLYEKGKIQSFLESVSASPNSSFAIVTGLTVSFVPDVVIKALISGIIFQLLSGEMLPILPFLGLMFFVAILSLFVVNLVLTLTLVMTNARLQLFTAFVISMFLIFSSGWIIPLDSFPSSLSPLLSFLPTTHLMEGGRLLLFRGEISFASWLIPLALSSLWSILNSAIYTKVSTV